MIMLKSQNGYNDATWFDDALSQLSVIVPTDDESVDENYNSLEPGLNQEDDSCEILLESYKGDIRDILSDPSKASKLLRAALKVLGKRNKAKLSKNALLTAISVLFSACQPGNFLSNTKIGKDVSEKYSSSEELASASSSELDELISSASELVIPSTSSSFHATDSNHLMKYQAGSTVSLMLSVLGRPGSEYSTNESIKTYRQLYDISAVDGCDAEYISSVQIMVKFVGPADTNNMDKIKRHASSTAFTTGLVMMNDIPTITVLSIPVPNTESLANILSHEIKHPFPYIVANIVHTHPLYSGTAMNAMVRNYAAYSTTLDRMEHINKTDSVWKIDGTRFDPLVEMVKDSCIQNFKKLLPPKQ